MEFLFGKSVAEKILSDVREGILKMEKRPGLGVILVGSDPASHLYVRLKEKKAEEIGMYFEKHIFPEGATEENIVKKIEEMNNDTNIDGMIVQMPLPDGLDAEKILSAMDPKKDADGFHHENISRFLSGENSLIPVFPDALLELAKSSGMRLNDLDGVVVANSEYFGSVMKRACEKEGMHMEVVFHEDIESKKEMIQRAKVIVSACGIPKLLTGENVTDGLLLLDGGITKVGDGVVGDIDPESLSERKGFLSPVPGGVGPVTIACLLRRVLFLARERV